MPHGVSSARSYLDAADDLRVVQQAHGAVDLPAERGHARAPEAQHFHGSGSYMPESGASEPPVFAHRQRVHKLRAR